MSRVAGKSNKTMAQMNASKGDLNKMVSARNPSPGTSGGAAFGGILADDASLEDHQSLAEVVAELEGQLTSKQEDFVKKERAYKLRIDELEQEIQTQRKEKTGWMKSNEKMTKLKEMQGDILYRVELVQDRTSKILQEQERDLLRAFRARLFDVQTELEKEKSKKDDGAVAWIERSRRLESEVEWTKEVADKLEGVNQALLQENTRLQSQFQYSKQEHGFMLEKLAAMTTENEMLRKRYREKDTENDKLKTENTKAVAEIQSMGVGGTMGGKVAHRHGVHETEEKYKENNIKLKKQLEEERKSHKAVTENLNFEISNQTELERILRVCVDDVRHEIARRNLELANYSNTGGTTADLARLYNSKPALVPIEDFKQPDRERVLEILLAQERVVNILYGNKHSSSAPTKHKLGSLNIADFINAPSGLGTGGTSATGAAAVLSPLSMHGSPAYPQSYPQGNRPGAIAGEEAMSLMSSRTQGRNSGKERPSTTGTNTGVAGAEFEVTGQAVPPGGASMLPHLSARPGTSGR